MLEHIGITINEESDIQTFYKDLLGMKEVSQFELDKDFSEKLFGIYNSASITSLCKDELFFELFLTDKKHDSIYNHVCISIHDRNSIINKAASLGFVVVDIKRESKDNLVFIKDNSGNIFEIKEANNPV